MFTVEVGARGYAACSLRLCLSRLVFIQRSVRDVIKKASDTALGCSFWMWLKRMDHYWGNIERRKENLVKGLNSKNPCNQQSGVHRKSLNNSLETQKNYSISEIRKNTSVKKSNKVSETSTQSKLSMNRKNPAVRKYMQSIKVLICLLRKSKPVTQKVMSNTQVLRKDLMDLET